MTTRRNVHQQTEQKHDTRQNLVESRTQKKIMLLGGVAIDASERDFLLAVWFDTPTLAESQIPW